MDGHIGRPFTIMAPATRFDQWKTDDLFEKINATNGRKRQFVVDTEGRLWVAHVHAASEADGPAGCTMVSSILWRVGERLEKVLGDQAYDGVFCQALANWSIGFEKASRPESAQGFVPVAKRWVVERSIAWTNRTGDPVLPPDHQGLRVHGIFFGKLALSG